LLTTGVWATDSIDKVIVSNIDGRVWRRLGEGRVWQYIFALLPVVLGLNDGAAAADPVLAPTGTLRAAYIVANLAQASSTSVRERLRVWWPTSRAAPVST
jgi:hypothetical protein